ncbi:MAG: hypothetical protein H7201_10415 [Candidatus Saccharibacteria bacterium]|nr:hypothetical protein [Microbacteriaceae bacterium]
MTTDQLLLVATTTPICEELIAHVDDDRFVAELRAENARRFLDENRCSIASTPSGSTEAVEVC